jgi:Ca2+-binding RTX toxin-like protein
MTGGLEVDATGAVAMTITGGSGADEITASATKADVIDGGAGNDTITAGFNGALLTGGAGNDLFVVGANSPVGNQEANTYSKIQDFSAGDKIQLSYWDTDASASSPPSTTAVDSFAKLQASLDESTATFTNFVNAAFQEMTSAGDAVWFMFGGDSYVVIDSNVDAGAGYTAQTGFTDGEDLIVRVEDVDLTGVSFNDTYGTIEVA